MVVGAHLVCQLPVAAVTSDRRLTTEFHALTVVEARRPRSVSLDQHEGDARALLPLTALARQSLACPAPGRVAPPKARRPVSAPSSPGFPGVCAKARSASVLPGTLGALWTHLDKQFISAQNPALFPHTVAVTRSGDWDLMSLGGRCITFSGQLKS